VSAWSSCASDTFTPVESARANVRRLEQLQSFRRMRILLVLAALAACGTDSQQPPPPPGGEPVYYGQVERILNDNCVECHSASPDRLAPFSLATYKDALDAANNQAIAFAVMNREMPPYYANNDGGCQSFAGDLWLGDTDMSALIAWTNGQHLEGDAANSVPPPAPPPDLASVFRTLDIGVDYTPQQSPDEYRCFVVDALGANKFLTGVHVHPGNSTIVHHVILFGLTSAEADADVVARDANEAGPGYTCFGGPTQLGTELLAGWVPGNAAVLMPDTTGIAIDGARKLVIQVHYNTANSNGQTDRTTIDLQVADSVANQALIMPVSGDVNLPPLTADAIATGTRTVPNLAASGRIWGQGLHMHTRGTRASVRTQDQCLIDLANWDFHWQHFYWYDQPVTVHAGDTLSIECHFDTSSDTQRVTWGEGTSDEMCLSFLYVSR